MIPPGVSVIKAGVAPIVADPEWQAAARKQALIRNAALLALPEEVCGFILVQMTVRQYITLQLEPSPVLTGATFGPLDLVAFLWFLSPGYEANRRSRRRFMRHCRSLLLLPPPWLPLGPPSASWTRKSKAREEYVKAVVAGVQEYLKETLMDAPPATQSTGPGYYSDGVWMLAAFGREFGWPPAVTMDLPIKVAFQLLAEIRSSRDMKGSLCNPLTEEVENRKLHGNIP